MSGSGISWAICKSAPRSRQITMPKPHHSVFYRPDALPAAQPTVSKHWKQKITHRCEELQKVEQQLANTGLPAIWHKKEYVLLPWPGMHHNKMFFFFMLFNATIIHLLGNSNLLLTANFFIGFNESIAMIHHYATIFVWSITKRDLHWSRLVTQ